MGSIDSPTADVAGYVISGASEAFQTQNFLYKQNATPPLAVKMVTVLCGPAYFDDTKVGIKKAMAVGQPKTDR